jgi:hypothetical protein
MLVESRDPFRKARLFQPEPKPKPKPEPEPEPEPEPGKRGSSSSTLQPSPAHRSLRGSR